MPGNRGYKYFGAARDLPGVRDLFETEAPGNTKKTRAELMKVSRLPSWAKSQESWLLENHCVAILSVCSLAVLWIRAF